MQRFKTFTLSIVSIVSACTTFNQKNDLSSDGGILSKNSSAYGATVTQVGATSPLLSSQSRPYWLDQRQAKALMPRAYGALATGEGGEAVKMAKTKLARNPADPGALTVLAAGLVMNHNYELATHYARVLERLQPGNAFALNVQGLALMLAPRSTVADYRLAREYFQKSIDADGGQIAAGLNLGSLDLELGDAAHAATVFKTVSDRCGQCVVGLLGYGRALSRSGDFTGAEQVFKSLLAKHPQNASAMYSLALVYKNGLNNKSKAQSYLMAVIHQSRTKDSEIRDRAQIVLRSLSSQKNIEERSEIAKESGSKSTQDELTDAEIMMTGSRSEGEEN